MKAYKIISSHYGDRCAERSGVPLINHIDEGLAILGELDASYEAMQAYCLHPLLQSTEDFNKNYKKNVIFKDIDPSVLFLAIEYRRVANSYLSIGWPIDFVGFTNQDIFHMLIADKIQNEKDFAKYHEATHKRSKELRKYFDSWFELFREHDKELWTEIEQQARKWNN